jgi:hypothetical protein
MQLKDHVREELTARGKTIPQLCKQFKVKNEFKMMRIIAELEYENKAVLEGFDKIYREDGGAIYLSKYSRKE